MNRKLTRWLNGGMMVCLFALLVLAGCGGGNREAALIGTWKVSSTLSAPANSATNAAAMQEFAKTVTLDLKADKSFTLTILFQFSGNWTFNPDDGTLTLNETKMGATDLTKMPGYNPATHKSPVLKLSNDNSQLTMQPDASDANQATPDSPVVFEKS